MTDTPLDPELTHLFAEFPKRIENLTLKLRGIILDAIPDVEERAYLGWRGAGYHHSDAGYVCGLFPRENMVRIGFTRGHKLNDPDGLLDLGRAVGFLDFPKWDATRGKALERFIDEALENW